VLSGAAARRIAKSKLQELVVTDTIRATPGVAAVHDIRAIPIGPLIGEAIARTAKEESVSSLFNRGGRASAWAWAASIGSFTQNKY
jgi:ribose-phosphate pyrophosphokinase